MKPLKLQFYKPKQTRVTIRPDSCYIKNKQATSQLCRITFNFQALIHKEKNTMNEKISVSFNNYFFVSLPDKKHCSFLKKKKNTHPLLLTIAFFKWI